MANRLQEFCRAIRDREGWGKPDSTIGGVYYPNGTLSYRNKNPGNLRWSKYQVGQRCTPLNQCYSYFNSETDGTAALEFDVRMKCLGNSKTGLGPDSTILQFCKKWDPETAQRYAEFLALRLNLSIYSTLKEIYSERVPLKILVLLANFPVDRESVIKDGFNAVAAYFGSLGVYTTVDYKIGTWLTNPVMIKGAAGENLDVIKDVWVRDPVEVKNIVKPFIQGTHLTMYCYRSEVGGTPTEFSEVFMGSVIGQLPVLDVSDSGWVSLFGAHELLHGFFHRLNAETLLVKDNVHSKVWKEGYGEIVKNLLPFLPVILRPIPDKPYTPLLEIRPGETRQTALVRFVNLIVNLMKSWSSPPR